MTNQFKNMLLYILLLLSRKN